MHLGINAHLLSFTSGYRRAGVSQYTEQLVFRLAEKFAGRNDALTIYLGRSDSERMATFPTVHWRSSRFPTAIPPVRIAWEQMVAPMITKRDRLDVLFCPVNVVPLAGLVSCVVTVHDLAFWKIPGAFIPAKRRYLSAMTRLSVHRARHVIAVSEQTKADIIAHFGLSPERVTVIPNAVDERFQPAAPTDDLAAFRRERKLPERYVLFVGTLEPRKNLPRLIRAFGQVVRDDPEVGLVVVGASGWLTSDIAPLVRSLDLESRIIFAGYVPDEELPRWYQAATVFCYPSLYEGFGLPVIEAMACGAPVVTANVGSMAEIGRDAALLVDPADVCAIATGIRTLLDDAEARRCLAASGLERAAEYSWDRTAEETLTLLRRVARET